MPNMADVYLTRQTMVLQVLIGRLLNKGILHSADIILMVDDLLAVADSSPTLTDDFREALKTELVQWRELILRGPAAPDELTDTQGQRLVDDKASIS
jgi:hypothetical protein